MVKKAHPNADATTLDAMADRTNAARQLVRSELWELIDGTNPQ